MVRVPIFHEGTFRAIVRVALRAGRCFRYADDYWEPLYTGRRFALYCRSSFSLAWIQQRVASYEFFLYSRLLHGHCGRDGVLRPRSRPRPRVRTTRGAAENARGAS